MLDREHGIASSPGRTNTENGCTYQICFSPQSRVIRVGVFLLLLLVMALAYLSLIASNWSRRGNEHSYAIAPKSISHRDYGGLQLFLVYHAYANPRNPLIDKLVYDQLSDVRKSGLFQAAQEFHVTVTCGAVCDDPTVNKTVQAVKTAAPQVSSIFVDNDPNFEYLGVHKAWELRKSCRSVRKCVILYFHSKSASNGFDGKRSRSYTNIMLNKLVVEDWRYVLDAFRTQQNLSLAGMNAGCPGYRYIFHKYWWARGAFLETLPEPEKMPHGRFYYEEWLGLSSEQDAVALELCERCQGIPSPDVCTENNMEYAIKCTDKLTAMMTGICADQEIRNGFIHDQIINFCKS